MVDLETLGTILRRHYEMRWNYRFELSMSRFEDGGIQVKVLKEGDETPHEDYDLTLMAEAINTYSREIVPKLMGRKE